MILNVDCIIPKVPNTSTSTTCTAYRNSTERVCGLRVFREAHKTNTFIINKNSIERGRRFRAMRITRETSASTANTSVYIT